MNILNNRMKKSKIFFLKPHTALTPFVSCGVIEISCCWHEIVNRKSLVCSEKQAIIE